LTYPRGGRNCYMATKLGLSRPSKTSVSTPVNKKPIITQVKFLPKLLPKNHIVLTSSYQVQSFCKILIPYGITSFGFTRIYNDCSRFVLSNRPDWVCHCYNKGYVYDTRLNKHPSCYQSGIYLWDAWDPSNVEHERVGQDAGQNFNIGRGLTILEKKENWIDKFEFASTPDNYSINNFYMNNLDFLNNFIQSFKEHLNVLIMQAINTRGIVPLSNHIDIYQDYPDTRITNKLSIIPNTPGVSNKNSQPRLTARELECIHWLIRGKTVPEIGVILNISKRTAEDYIANVKDKLGCYTLFQLGNKLNSLGLENLNIYNE